MSLRQPRQVEPNKNYEVNELRTDNQKLRNEVQSLKETVSLLTKRFEEFKFEVNQRMQRFEEENNHLRWLLKLDNEPNQSRVR
jgi:peptidoglycan hydrolase CwlO-like protein